MKYFSNPAKRCAAVHDLSCYGHTSLMSAIPILNMMGVQVAPLPTALLSAHTQIEGFSFLDLTEEMEKIVAHWKRLGLHLDAIYSGFLGSHEQVRIVEEMIEWQRKNNPLVVVDPVLGDNGALYDTIGQPLVAAMRTLVRHADVITPNITELCYLLGEDFHTYSHEEDLLDDIRTMSQEGPEIVIVTSVPNYRCPGATAVVGYYRADDRFWRVPCNYLPGAFPGTGDAFASVVTGALLQGDSLPIALERAVQFATMGVRAIFGYQETNAAGIYLERVLPTLLGTSPMGSFELIDKSRE